MHMAQDIQGYLEGLDQVNGALASGRKSDCLEKSSKNEAYATSSYSGV